MDESTEAGDGRWVLTNLGSGRFRVERDGHTFEGIGRWLDGGFSFDGFAVCGPHGENGQHLEADHG